jgi:hypothetical protein
VDPDVTPASCPPDPDNLQLCDDGVEGGTNAELVPGEPPADNPLPLAKAFLQKDLGNVWQADSADWSAAPVYVDWIDWGDNLESVDWYTRSQVRTEVVLFQDLTTPMTEYEMRHTSDWGSDEVHGLATVGGTVSLGPGTRATVYSPCARLTIQKLLVQRDHDCLQYLEWVPGTGWTEPDSYPEGVVCPDLLIKDPIFNKAVHEAKDGPGYYNAEINVKHEAKDGPGYYNAEINVKGRIIYGYTWSVRKLNDDGAGPYRLTFSFDTTCGGTVPLNTFFVDGVTSIIMPAEEVIEEEPGGGGTAELDTVNNLTYMDVLIHERGGGGGGNKPAKTK